MDRKQEPIAGPERELYMKMGTASDETINAYYAALRGMDPKDREKWRRGTSTLDLTRLRRALRKKR